MVVAEAKKEVKNPMNMITIIEIITTITEVDMVIK